MKIAKLIRWKYVLPRLVVALAVVLATRFCLDGALRWAIISSGQATLGAKVEIGDLTTSFGRGEIVLTDFAAANPAKPMKNIAAAQAARLKIDVGALLHKRLVVTDGIVAGLEFDAPRETSGALPRVAPGSTGPSALDPLVAAAEDHAVRWLDDLAGNLERDLTESFQTPQVAEELRQRWPTEYADLKAQVEQLQERGKKIEATYKQVKGNPLRNLPALEQLQTELAAADSQLKTLTARINGLPAQIEVDRARIESAKAHDEQFLREQAVGVKLDGDELSRYLLESETSGTLATAVSWIKRLRALAPDSTARVDPSQRRGVNLLYLDRVPPTWLVRRVGLAGSARLGGNALELVGELRDASSDQRLHGKPMTIALRSSGALEAQLQFTMDRTGDAPLDRLTLAVPRLSMPARTVGAAEKFQLAVSSGPASLRADVTLTGDQLAGTIALEQADVRLTAKLAAVDDPALSEALDESLQSVTDVAATFTLAGTLDRPEWQIDSNLGPSLAAGVKAAMGEYLRARGEAALAKTRAKVDRQMAELGAKRQAAQDELLAKLGENNELLASLAPLLNRGQGFSLPHLGNLPAGLLKR